VNTAEQTFILEKMKEEAKSVPMTIDKTGRRQIDLAAERKLETREAENGAREKMFQHLHQVRSCIYPWDCGVDRARPAALV
jgi:hypothetical protein